MPCSYAALRYMDMARESHDSRRALFRSINAKKQSLNERGLSYTRIREIVIEMLRYVVDDVSKFGVHSLRSGGATAAASGGIWIGILNAMAAGSPPD